MRRQWHVTLALILLLTLALVLRLWGIGFGLPQRYHVDEPPYVLAALRIATGDLHITYPYNSPNLFEFMLTGLYGAWYLLGHGTGRFGSPADFAALYHKDPSGFYILARGLVALISTITVGLVYLLGTSLSGRLVGLLAAGFLSIAFAHAREAHYAVTDTLVTAMVVTALLGAVLYTQEPRQRYLVLSAMMGGMAIGLKYLPAPVMLPPLLAILSSRGPRMKTTIRNVLKGIVIVGGSGAAGFLLAFPAPLISFDLFETHWSQVWAQAAAPLGGIRVDSAPAPLYYLKSSAWGLGVPMLIASLLGLLGWMWRRRPTEYAFIVILTICYFVGICLVRTAFARYALPLVPLLVLLAAKAVTDVTHLFARQRSSQFAVVVGLALSLGLVSIPAASLIRHNVLLTRTDTRTLAADWIEGHIPAGAYLAVQRYGPALSTDDDPEPGSSQTYRVELINPWDLDPEAYDVNTYQKEQVVHFVLNSWNRNFLRSDAFQTYATKFYAQVEAKAKLVARFTPTSAGSDVPFVFEQVYGPYTSLWQIERPGPEIEVYTLPGQQQVPTKGQLP